MKEIIKNIQFFFSFKRSPESKEGNSKRAPLDSLINNQFFSKTPLFRGKLLVLVGFGRFLHIAGEFSDIIEGVFGHLRSKFSDTVGKEFPDTIKRALLLVFTGLSGFKPSFWSNTREDTQPANRLISGSVYADKQLNNRICL